MKNLNNTLSKKLEKYMLKVEKPSRYIGNEINSIHKKSFTSHMCLIFPDIYEVGMSNLGLRILYNILNKVPNFYLERGFHPNDDMEKFMREDNISAFSLESKTPLKDFDILGFSLSYELSYPSVLNILDLAGIPFKAQDRGEEFPIIMGGGTCMMNPVPMESFFDFIVIGDGEDNMPLIAKLMVENQNKSKKEKLEIIKDIEGVYIPSIHKGNKKIQRAIVRDYDNTEYYENQLVPYMEIVHDRAMVEIQRGCSRGCRFCQAGIVYRPQRERSFEKNVDLINKMLKETGYSAVSLSSLSSSDYPNIQQLIEKLKSNPKNKNLSISLPSLRMNPHSVKITEEISGGKRPSFTFAPEAGSQKMRDVINKGVSEEEIIETAITALNAGWESFKFYFMIGLPFETDEDIVAIYDLVMKVMKSCRSISKRISITVSVSNFVPKPHTPFQWHKQMDFHEMDRKHSILRELFFKAKGCSLKIHDKRKSYLEGLVSRGDEDTGKLIELAWKKGAKLEDSRDNFYIWTAALEELNINPNKYLGERNLQDILPWDFVEIGVTKEFLINEYQKGEIASLTPQCREKCSNCGINKLIPKMC